MAEPKTVTYAALMRDLEAGNYSPLYFLHGDESYYIDRICDYIATHALPPEARDFNQTVVFGSDTTAAAVADMARRYPMMSTRQVVIVKEAQNLRGTEALERYVRQPMDTTVLVVCHKNGTIDGRKREFVKNIQLHGVLFESKKLRERDLPPFIENYLRAHQATIDPKSTQIIADSIGADLNRLAGELDKLLLSLPENDRRITPDVVEQQIGVSKDFNGFELRDAIVNKNVFKANQIIDYFDKNPKAGSLYSFLPLLFNYFQNLLLAHYSPNRGSQEQIAEWLELRSPWAARDYVTGLRNYSARKVVEILDKLRETDAQSKGLDNVNTPPGELMKVLIFFILH